MGFDKIIKGGTVVVPNGTVKADVAIAGEKIVAIGDGLAAMDKNATIIDAKGHLVIPGVLDVHVHLELPFCGTTSSDDYRSGTRAGARGGVTTLIDFAIPYAKNDGSGKYDTLNEAVDNWHKKAEGKAMIDYTFHVCLTQWNQHKHEIEGIIERGFATFKEFMIYANMGWASDDRALFGALEKMHEHGTMLLLHAESPRVLDELIERYHTPALMKKHGAMLHAITRPNYIEAEAIERAVHFCKITGGQLYIVHMSTGEGADIIRHAQTKGVPVVAETCIQYLTMDDSWFKKKDGHLYACCPQIKTPKDIERLWEGLETGEVSVISTDTCSFTKKQKAMWKGDFTKIPMGMPGLETLLPASYTEGVLNRKMPIEDLMMNLSTNPAKLMGLYPKKGSIEVGADADIAIIHPTKKIKVDYKTMETNADWNPFQGQELAGFARTTLSRGEVIVDNYKVVGKEGRGKWLPRRTAGWYHEHSPKKKVAHAK